MSLHHIVNLKKLKLLRVTLADIRSAVTMFSTELNLSKDGMFIRRRHPLPPTPPVIGRDGLQVCLTRCVYMYSSYKFRILCSAMEMWIVACSCQLLDMSVSKNS